MPALLGPVSETARNLDLACALQSLQGSGIAKKDIGDEGTPGDALGARRGGLLAPR